MASSNQVSVQKNKITKVPGKTRTLLSRLFPPSRPSIERGTCNNFPDPTLQGQATATLQSYYRNLRTPELASSTASKYRQCLRVYVDWLKDQVISESSAKEFLCELSEKGFADSSVRFYYHALRPFLLSQGIPLKLRLKKNHIPPQYRNIAQVKAILAVAGNRSDKWRQLAERDWLMLAIFAYTGIRRAELLALRPRDIDFIVKTIRVHGKGKKERIIPIHEVLLKPLQDYISNIPPHHFLFPLRPHRVHTIVCNYARKAGVTSFHPHAFRHFFATQLVERGVPLHHVQQLLGHSDLSTTAIYLDVTSKHLEKAVLIMPDLT